uniref:Cupin type-2 domain-containing protein n=2 Tax=Dunaliella tertiolecta TaxID=3047 RepID=A0A7S3R5D7_DUNTE|mmetsp:Transcript_5468/g.14773  ORF Transcript_5468/g.14773 Transcript_5468/m.14773 type:complete len:303 (-) Transcript_5468:347-1255(-)
MPSPLSLLALLSLCVAGVLSQTCSSNPSTTPNKTIKEVYSYDYSQTFSEPKKEGIAFQDLPGFTRSTYSPDHALITPESRVWAGQPGWKNALTAHLISPASGASFSMFMAHMKPDSEAAPAPAETVERFILVLEGEAQATSPEGKTIILPTNHYAYFPPNTPARLRSATGAGLLIYERVYKAKGNPVFLHGYVEDSPLLATPGETFQLRKLLPQTTDYDFNIHIMDFNPGEYLNVKEVHYNQHGLMLLDGKGIYRLADKWYPVQAGDAIWMAPYVVQWYAALGTTPSRYIINKDTTVDPLFS